MRISWTEKKLNEEVMEMVRYENLYSKPSEKRQLQFLGIGTDLMD